MGAGIIGAVLAAALGAIDLFWLRDPEQKRIGLIHATLSVLGLTLFVINWLWRLNDATFVFAQLLLSLTGVLVILGSGWLDAKLVHEFGITIDEKAISEGRAHA